MTVLDAASTRAQASALELPLTLALEEAFERAAAGEPLAAEHAEALLNTPARNRDRLLNLATDIRNQGLARVGRAGMVTYSRKVFVPLTTLCRDRCHYCVFVDTPNQLLAANKPMFMSPEQVLAVVKQGAVLGCKEALLTLGDRPEQRWPEARAWLDQHGYSSTLDYLGQIARLITAETGMLVHLNPGVMTAAEMRALRPVAPSMGMMLETTSRRLFSEPGQVHYGSPDKDPQLRLRVIEDAGALRIPFTTGVLVGIGETVRDRAESLIALRDAHARHGHLQEIIVQNFRAKPRTAMRNAPDASSEEYLRAVATARLVFGPDIRIQVPPNLSDPAELELLVRAGVDDWGGVSPLTADHVNPERPWPHLVDLAESTARLGFTLRERLTAHPEYLADPDVWLDPAMHPAVRALADPGTHLARDAAPENTAHASAPHTARGTHADLDSAPETASDGPAPLHAPPSEPRRTRVKRTGLPALADAAAADPTGLEDADWVTLLLATDTDLDHLTETADAVRRYTVGEAVSLVINRNLTSTGLRAQPRHPAEFSLEDVPAIAADAWDLGATELCVQGKLTPDEDPSGYLAIARAARDAAPGLHLHAYRPQDVWDLADRTGLSIEQALTELRTAGVATMPGAGVKILSERVRALLFPGTVVSGTAAPTDIPIDRWVEAITAAHRAGMRTSSVLFYGHVETAAERIAHLRLLRQLQDAGVGPRDPRLGGARQRSAERSWGGGFTEFVPIPLPPSPQHPAAGIPLVDGRGERDEHRAMVAVARLMLSGSIPHIQIPWTRLGLDTAATLLRSGGDDLGGTLLDGRVRPEAGIEHGLTLPVRAAAKIAARLHRPFRQRSTDYREVFRR